MRVIALALVSVVFATSFTCSSAHGRKHAANLISSKHFTYEWTVRGFDKPTKPIRTSVGTLSATGTSTEIHLDKKSVLTGYTSDGLILSGEGVDLGGAVALLFNYRAGDNCMGCSSKALVLLDKNGAVVAKREIPWTEVRSKTGEACDFGGLSQRGKEGVSEIKGCDAKHLGVLKINLQGITREQ